jgi:hypothetical protein
MKTITLLALATVIASPSLAEDARHVEAHEHGVGQLDIAFEGSSIAMELHSPGADIVGFEYAAKSEEDHKAIDAAVAILSKPLDLFGIPADAGCKVVNAKAMLEGDDAHDDDHEDKHDDHDHDDKHDDHDKDEHDEHDDDHDEGEDEGHAEFHAEYMLECSDVTAVTEMTFPYFEAFPNAKELELQVITKKGASAFEIERDEASVNLSEMF